jgi:hypothetical protein
MSKHKTGVKAAKNPPRPKQSGIIRNTPEWKNAVQDIEAGKSIEIRLNGELDLRNPVNAFVQALKRKYRRSHNVYAREGVIYAIPKAG